MDEQGSGPADGAPKVEVRRSSRRKRTVTAYRERDTIVVLLPARMSAREERESIPVGTEPATHDEQMETTK